MKNNNFQAFDINLYQLKNQEYSYNYSVNNSFFAEIENSLVEKGELEVSVVLNKTDHSLIVLFAINGNIELTCDKSWEVFQEPIMVTEKIIYKFGENDEEVSESLFIIRRDTQKINLAQNIYELIAVNVPFKKVHPKYRSDDEESSSNGVIIFKTEAEDVDTTNSTLDPRWAELLKLRKN